MCTFAENPCVETGMISLPKLLWICWYCITTSYTQVYKPWICWKSIWWRLYPSITDKAYSMAAKHEYGRAFCSSPFQRGFCLQGSCRQELNTLRCSINAMTSRLEFKALTKQICDPWQWLHRSTIPMRT